MAKGNKEKGRKLKLIVVFVVIIATSFLGFAGIFQPAQPPSAEQSNPQGDNQGSSVATSTLPVAFPATSSSQKVGGINENLK